MKSIVGTDTVGVMNAFGICIVGFSPVSRADLLVQRRSKSVVHEVSRDRIS